MLGTMGVALGQIAVPVSLPPVYTVHSQGAIATLNWSLSPLR